MKKFRVFEGGENEEYMNLFRYRLPHLFLIAVLVESSPLVSAEGRISERLESYGIFFARDRSGEEMRSVGRNEVGRLTRL